MTDESGATDGGPGILETSLVLGLAALLGLGIVAFFGGALADAVGVLVGVAHGGK